MQHEMYDYDDHVSVFLNDADLKPYNITAEELYSGKPFEAKLIDDLMKEASKRFGRRFKYRNGTGLQIHPYGLCAIVSFS